MPPMVTPEAKNANTGTAKRRGDGPDLVLEALGEPVGVGPAVAAAYRDRERQQHAGHGRVHAGRVHQRPGDGGDGEEDVRRTAPAAAPGPRRRAIGSSASARNARSRSSV